MRIRLLIKISLWLVELISFCQPAPLPYFDSQRIQAHADYLQLRNNCSWQQWDGPPRCSGYRMDCVIENVDVAEGIGLLQISRYGPFVTRGGVENVQCMEATLMPPRGSWLKSYTIQVIDPYTEDTMSFPPIHLHHAVPQYDIYAPALEEKWLNDLPFLSQGRFVTKSFISPSAAADSQCIEPAGGTACYTFEISRGYGKHFVGSSHDNMLVMHSQDVRNADSPPLAHVIEYATLHIIDTPSSNSFSAGINAATATEVRSSSRLSTTSDLKPVVEAAFVMLGTGKEFTYPVEFDRAMFALNTYYFATRTQLLNVRIHWHPANGDEMWLVRGRQEDLDLPLYARKGVIVTLNDSVKSFANFLPFENSASLSRSDNRNAESAALEQFKRVSETALLNSATNWHRHKKKINSKHLHTSTGTRNVRFFDEQIANLGVEQLPRSPEIICKYFEQNEEVTEENLVEWKRRLAMRYNSIDTTSAIARQPRRRRTAKIADFDSNLGYSSLDTTTVLSIEQQQRNMLDGVLPGSYYRAGISSTFSGNQANEHCNSFEMLPGEFLTVIHFLMPRKHLEFESNVFDPTEATTNQHTVMRAWAHLPDVYMY